VQPINTALQENGRQIIFTSGIEEKNWQPYARQITSVETNVTWFHSLLHKNQQIITRQMKLYIECGQKKNIIKQTNIIPVPSGKSPRPL
jgi:hypothetical protein